MPLDPSFAGRTYPPTPPYLVSREKIREFADAIGDPDPLYRDPDAARAAGHPDVLAPPTFPVVLTWSASARLIGDPALGLDFSRVVHGDQRFDYHRPVCAGDTLTCVVAVENIQAVAGNDMITVRAEVTTEAGEPVVAVTSRLVARGKP